MKSVQVFSALVATVCAVPLASRDTSDPPGLYFSNGKFEITVFSDLHVGDDGVEDEIQKGAWSDNLTIGVMEKVLDSEPATGLAIINGDLLSCEWVAEKDSYGLLDKVMAPFLDRKLHFATTFGNHDWSQTCNTRWMSEHIWSTANEDKNLPKLTFTTSSVAGDPNLVGTSNYFIPLYSKVDGKQVLKMVLWFFDSKGGFGYTGSLDNKVPVYSYVHPDVINWFKQTRAQLEHDHGGKTIPSLVFVHIPLAITAKYDEAGLRVAATMPGIQWKESLGVQDDPQGTPLMQALVETDGLLGVFSGHDHSTDWCMKWTKTPAPIPADWPPAAKGNGLNVCFGRHTGYGGYSKVMRGGRHIVIYEDALGGDNAVETWIRLEDGEISGRVMLNSTYGTDQYQLVKVIYSQSQKLKDVVSMADVDLSSTTTSLSTKTTTSTVSFKSKVASTSKLITPTTSSKSTKSTTAARSTKTTTVFPKSIKTMMTSKVTKTKSTSTTSHPTTKLA